jgi:hypothetical protein
MFKFNVYDFMVALSLVVLLLWGDAIVDSITPGRIERHIEQLETSRMENRQ